jgi:uncharacterized protein
MASLAAIDLAQVRQHLGLPAGRVEAVVSLLDSGNTVPFITRYRKDQTGGLDEEQIREIQSRVLKLRLLAERKQTILRSIESQGKLTPELAQAIEAAETTKRLEDLYLPYKPKKQTLATTARSRGLEPLALEILNADPACADLDARARDFVNPDRQVMTPADALLGAGHVLAEMFSERADLRGKLRAIMERTGKLVSTATEPVESATKKPEVGGQKSEVGEEKIESAEGTEVGSEADPSLEAGSEVGGQKSEVGEEPSEVTSVSEAETAAATASVEPETTTATLEAPAVEHRVEAEAAPAAEAKAEQPKPEAKTKREKKKKKEKKEVDEHKAFRDYFQFSELLTKVPPHRVLAINRGERAKALRVRVDVDTDAMYQVIDELVVPPGHPHADFLRGCGRDALARLVLPSLEREFRRELTDRAELHAVEVFARNLRNLLLQPPVRQRRILAIDPGFKSGCKLVALDEFGNLLDHAVIHIIGKEERRTAAKTKLLEMVKQHQLTVIVIGNGTACRETEQMVSDVLAADLADQGVAYVIVNEAGASVYSTSRIGREEFPKYDATLRGAISIGRRLQDPLSEFVKIDAANIGVGMYQHDVKAKHLRDSLDAVVESCVNYVGVDLNTASPALLRYVSGLNQLTAQRVYEHRTANGPFKSREELKKVSGFGEGAFVQAAGFLKIVGGENPLDATWIHPESYAAAEQVLTKLGATPADLLDKERAAELPQKTIQIQVDQVATESGIGTLTLQDILAQLARPGRDPRESLPPPIFKRGVLKLDDLTSGMELNGTVLNVVDFGAFVDIGLKDSGLVHISQLADRYVQDPHDVVSVGDIVKVWVLEVDKQRRRVSLTMIQPGTRRPPEARRSHKPGGQGRPVQQGEGQSQGEGAPRQQRPPRPPRPAPVGAGQSGPPQHQGKGRPKFKSRPSGPPPKPKAPPKPLVPLTKAMKEGKAPLRTFGDLMQFMALKQGDEKKEGEAEKK